MSEVSRHSRATRWRSFIQSMELDYMDYTLVGSATWAVEDGHLVLRIPLA